MSPAKQLVADIDYLERAGMTTAQLRELHHWGGDADREGRVSFASVRDYFSKDQGVRENNAGFAERLRLVASMHQRGIQALVEHALARVPRT